MAVRAEEEERAKAARASDDDDPEKASSAEGDGDSEEAEGTEPSAACSSCGIRNEDDAKFCDQCGASMAAKPMAGEKDDDAPPSSKPKPGNAASVSAPKRLGTDATLASILGATSDSVPALRTAALDLRQIRDTAAGVTGAQKSGEIVGALLGIPEQLADGRSAAKDLAKQTKEAEKSERWALAKRLNGLGLSGRPRSSIFIDEVSRDGKRTAVKLMPEYQTMDLSIFRGLVSSLEKKAPSVRRNPFDPDAEKAKEAEHERKGAPSGEPTVAQIKAAESHPAVIRMYNSPSNTHPIDRIAKQFLLAAQAAGGSQ